MLPSEVTKQNIRDFEFNIFVASEGIQDEIRNQNKLKKEFTNGKR